MTDFSLWFLIIAVVLISFTLMMFGLSVIPWCIGEAKHQPYYMTSWKRMAIPEHDSFSVTLPPLPPYFFGNQINYDDFSETI